MTIYSWLVGGCWAVFLVYWLVAGIGTKRSLRTGSRHVLLRAAITAALLLLVRSRAADVRPGFNGTIPYPAVRMLGVVLCAGSIAYAIWARRHIGKNWGMPMSVKDAPELVNSGPYSRIRHPIYAGVLLALVGSALAVSLWWFVATVIAFVYFGYAARKEEATMISAFPREYAEYQRQTKMIVPFLF